MIKKVEVYIMQKYPVYYEVSCWDANENTKEGGFIFAIDFKDATEQLIALYEPGMESMHIEFMEDVALTFPVEKARIVKKVVEENGY
jgi:hypothetical protein